MTMKDKHEVLFREALDYLAERADMESVRRHMDGVDDAVPTTLADIYVRFLLSLSNRQAMSNSIGDIWNLEEVLEGFEPDMVLRRYSTWEELFDRVKATVHPPGRMVKSNPQSYWAQFCKGALDGAKFLAEFKTLERFTKFVDGFYSNDDLKPELPHAVARRIYGMGFALACDFLKEVGYTDYAKPDVHLKAIMKGVGLSDGSDEDTSRAAIAMAKDVGETTYAVDKALWLIGSGFLYHDGVEFETDRDEFIARARRALKKVDVGEEVSQ